MQFLPVHDFVHAPGVVQSWLHVPPLQLMVHVAPIEQSWLQPPPEQGAAVMVIVFEVDEHPFASVTVTEYDPVAFTTILDPVWFPGDQT